MTTDGASVLVVDDEARYLRALKATLEGANYRVMAVASGEAALAALEQAAFDLILLDVRMPGLDGLETCRCLRQFSLTPVIMLTALAEEGDRIRGLDAGADDYVTKPFGQEELLARVRAFLRRSYVSAKTSGTKIEIDDLRIDLAERRIFIAGNDLHLTKTEYAILAVLARHLDSIVTHDELIAEVWGSEYRGSNHYLHTYLGRLRKKLGEYGALIETVPGMGYDLHSKKIY